MSLSLDEKRKSLTNTKSDVLDARVIANYGDPGLDEDYHFDVLSRFVIVMIESSLRVPTQDRWNRMFAIVARPRQLWINVEEGRAAIPNSQKRSDAMGNLNIGLAASPTVAGIPRINFPYQIGEVIKIKKLANPLRLTNSTLFTSQFSDVNFNTYGSWHSEGQALPYFAGQQERINALKNKTVYNPSSSNLFQYGMRLYKYQYEAFMLTLLLGNNTLTSYLTSIFANSLPNTDAVYDGHGGYVFKSTDFVNFLAVEYEDININNKQRLNTNECMPLIVTTPNSFPTPKSRALGTIAYSPTYATIVKQ